MGKLRDNRKQRRARKTGSVRDGIKGISAAITSIPSLITAPQEVEASLNDSVESLTDLRDNQLPAAHKAAPYIIGSLAVSSLIFVREIYKEIR